ncbi:putative ubiquitin activating enzyme [Trypanosoma theileri]|uniref:Adenylyltransferase and sulfurtransferase MOCS3 homolog n=1 Tax=Trypanosoma theileri TaxID=67003 RepID=A0A1X0P4G1_9TRYP|nr:putative ubiquitin activating enzyme [Trypanosoma theileri]ORC91765.1 putative ubiquitin activating enzyme [Trypanosoma theileri]
MIRSTELEVQVEEARLKLQDLKRQLREKRAREALEEASDENNVSKSYYSDSRDSSTDGSHNDDDDDDDDIRNGSSGNGVHKGEEELPPFISAAKSLTKEEIERFSRQMLVEGIGAEGMERIRKGRVLLLGAGGLGSTVSLFLAAAGIGTLRVVDFDRVERSNLHRQVIHPDRRVGYLKVDSVYWSCQELNSGTIVEVKSVRLDASNAEELMKGYDVVVDGSDNVAARYVVNDAAMRQGIPLVSGSAMRWDGQLSVYGYGDGPCYRCLFPVPPPVAAVGSCNDTGVMGPVPGCIGCLQALETLKILAGAGEVLAGRMLLFDGLRANMRVVQLRRRRENCIACGKKEENNKTLLELAAERPEYDLVSCGLTAAIQAKLPNEARITPREFYAKLRSVKFSAPDSLVLDVRTKEQYDMAHLPGALSLPLLQLQKWHRDGVLRDAWMQFVQEHSVGNVDCKNVYVVCRRGVSSVAAVQILLTLYQEKEEEKEKNEDHINSDCKGNNNDVDDGSKKTSLKGQFRFINVDGGLNRYHYESNKKFPLY